MWYDPDPMDKPAWLLTRPSCLSIPGKPPARKEQPAFDAPCMKILGVFELLDLILFATIDDEDWVVGLKTLLSFCQVNRFLHDALTHSHQAIWLRIAALHGWMLPSTPAHWQEWGVTELNPRLDWYSFVLANLQQTAHSVKNRRRMERMCEQFANGRTEVTAIGRIWFSWQVGKLSNPTPLTPPAPWSWETWD
ncbi:hypothetical protein FB45DRAFT_876560 [Roridomyces roridus]|uniref:Uncharacterized protein n=1 Tax=Roridomyces roridus TaxID=1738132 RepID=A0AAD7B407_9AGAR|nr:hypothetical protein FB45DRAFT_876560 [Roridomyces roridus]